jgi:hypothetical protein
VSVRENEEDAGSQLGAVSGWRGIGYMNYMAFLCEHAVGLAGGLGSS